MAGYNRVIMLGNLTWNPELDHFDDGRLARGLVSRSIGNTKRRRAKKEKRSASSTSTRMDGWRRFAASISAWGMRFWWKGG